MAVEDTKRAARTKAELERLNEKAIKKMKEKSKKNKPSPLAPKGHPDHPDNWTKDKDGKWKRKDIGLGPMGQKMSNEMKKKGALDALGGQREGKAVVKKKKGGGHVGGSIKTYSSGGYVEGK